MFWDKKIHILKQNTEYSQIKSTATSLVLSRWPMPTFFSLPSGVNFLWGFLPTLHVAHQFLRASKSTLQNQMLLELWSAILVYSLINISFITLSVQSEHKWLGINQTRHCISRLLELNISLFPFRNKRFFLCMIIKCGHLYSF